MPFLLTFKGHSYKQTIFYFICTLSAKRNSRGVNLSVWHAQAGQRAKRTGERKSSKEKKQHHSLGANSNLNNNFQGATVFSCSGAMSNIKTWPQFWLNRLANEETFRTQSQKWDSPTFCNKLLLLNLNQAIYFNSLDGQKSLKFALVFTSLYLKTSRQGGLITAVKHSLR